MPDDPLPGGFVNAVVRVDDTVRRPPPHRAEYVHALLRHLEQHGWHGAPRFLGTDDNGREILSFLDGHVAWQPVQPPDVRSNDSLVQVVELVRQFHDLTAATPLAENHEVVCHNDLSPKNTIYRDLGGGLRPVAFIDWDLAAPGARIHDLAHVCWQYLNLGPTITDIDGTAQRIRLICDAYGMTNRTHLVETILWWQDRCWRGIETAATAGDPAMIRLRDSGAAATVQAAHRWTTTHRQELQADIE